MNKNGEKRVRILKTFFKIYRQTLQVVSYKFNAVSYFAHLQVSLSLNWRELICLPTDYWWSHVFKFYPSFYSNVAWLKIEITWPKIYQNLLQEFLHFLSKILLTSGGYIYPYVPLPFVWHEGKWYFKICILAFTILEDHFLNYSNEYKQF